MPRACDDIPLSWFTSDLSMTFNVLRIRLYKAAQHSVAEGLPLLAGERKPPVANFPQQVFTNPLFLVLW